jgi:hypothetical protein
VEERGGKLVRAGSERGDATARRPWLRSGSQVGNGPATTPKTTGFQREEAGTSLLGKARPRRTDGQ